MTLFDFILNVTGLLIWLSWLARRFDPLMHTAPATLAGTVRRAEPSSFRGWYLPTSLALLLASRALFYFEIGSAIGWTPKLDLGLVVLAFRSDHAPAILLFSALSFGRVLAVYYFWILVLVLLNWRSAEPEPILKLLRLQLGWFCRLPWVVLLILPVLCVTLIWLGLHPLLLRLGLVNAPANWIRLVAQSVLLSVPLVLSLKYLLSAILLGHLAATYVYLGSSPLWQFVNVTASAILAPLRWVPLRFAKLDLAPVVGLLLVLCFLHWGPQLLDSELARRGILTWPE